MPDASDALSVHSLLNYVPPPALLAKRIILVTGAANGLGRAIALACARFGATVVLLDKQIKQLERVYDEIELQGFPEAAIYPLDMQGATAEHYQELANNIKEQLGGLDGLVLNAAWLPAFMTMKHYETDLWFKVMNINVNANFLLTRSCLPLLEASPDPSVVFSGHLSNKAYFGAFGVAKSAMNGFCDILAQEYDNAPCFMRINRIDSGPILTRMRMTHFPGEDSMRLARPESVVGPYLFYLGPDAGKRTQENLQLEGLDTDYQWPGEPVAGLDEA